MGRRWREQSLSDSAWRPVPGLAHNRHCASGLAALQDGKLPAMVCPCTTCQARSTPW